MRKLTPQEKKWVEDAYPLIAEAMKEHRLSDNDTVDWHGELSVTLCEAITEISPYSFTTVSVEEFRPKWIAYAKTRLNDCIGAVLETAQYRNKEIPFGLRPQKAAGRGRSL